MRGRKKKYIKKSICDEKRIYKKIKTSISLKKIILERKKINKNIFTQTKKNAVHVKIIKIYINTRE